MKRDIGLDVLLDLHNTEYTEECGVWYKIEAWLVEPTPEIPHGIRYNLTLHNQHNERIMGFDNAHAIKNSVRSHHNYSGRIMEYDHMHKSSHDKGSPYLFKTAEQLLNDFFSEVNKVIESINRG